MEKAIFLVLILKIFFVATATAEETCKSEREIEELCGPHTYKTVKPMLDYFRQIRNELEISEFKEKQLSELNSNLMDKYHEIVKLHEKVIKEASLIDQYKNQIQSKENELQLYKVKFDKLESDLELQRNTINGLTPNSKFFEHFDKCKEELVVESKNLEICEVQLKKLNSTVIEKDENISGYNAKIQNMTENLKKIEVQFDENQTKLKNKEKDQQVCQGEVDKLNEALQNSIPSSCIPFEQYPGYREIKVLGSGIFSVVCDSQLAGPGWIVIQQRVGGNQSFDRDWATYRKGFGYFNTDFFSWFGKYLSTHKLAALRALYAFGFFKWYFEVCAL
ncbi:angiopoietin-2-like isoform X1 [Drosophila nasuta]|uniref:angiopoietin-2-like isoform X1 n=1 Tax=Drosophila nasuta TaxID=42062 RepID=UPI00295F2DD9|nr:angiopoietin-2-like isoform X1 [Drosophila nasuta]